MQEVEQHYLIKQMDLVPQMDLGLVLHKQAAARLYMPHHHTNCSEWASPIHQPDIHWHNKTVKAFMEETYTSPDDFDHIPNFLGKMHIICNNKTKTKTKKNVLQEIWVQMHKIEA